MIEGEGVVPEIDVAVEADGWPAEDDLQALVARVVKVACAEAQLELVEGAELSVVFADDVRVRYLPRAGRDPPAPVDVLSFPGAAAPAPPFGPLLGDIVLARETVAREAEAMDVAFSDHVTHLVAHGFLHLFGYDHQMEDEAEEMEALERRILAVLGIADPYRDPLVSGTETESETPV